MSDSTLAGRGAIVTGAGSGIGLASARALAEAGMSVACVVRDPAQVSSLVSETDGRCFAVVADLADPAQAEHAVEAAYQRLGRVHVLVNSAGIGVRANLASTTLEQYESMFAVNVRSVFVTCHAAIPRMLADGGGVIINIASSLAAKGARDRAIYASTKAAVVALTRSIAVDFGAAGIRANCVAPGTTDTPWIGRILAGAPNPGELRAQMAARQAIGRLGTAEEIAAVVRFLATDEASFVHGASIAVDGGQTAW